MTQKRNEILSTALELFVFQGFENTPTALLSEKARVATGTLFHHFKNKEHLLNQLYLDCKQSLKAALSEDLESAKEPRSRLYIIWRNHIRWASENTNKFRFLEKYNDHPAILPQTREAADKAYEILFNLLQKSYVENLLANLPFEYLVSLTEMNFAAAANYCIRHPGTLDKKKLPKRMFDAYWKSIKH